MAGEAPCISVSSNMLLCTWNGFLQHWVME